MKISRAQAIETWMGSSRLEQLNWVWKHCLNHCNGGYKCPWRWVETANSWLCSLVVEVIKRRPLAALKAKNSVLNCCRYWQAVWRLAFNSKYSAKTLFMCFWPIFFETKLLRNVARSQLNLSADEIRGLSDVIKLIAARDLPEPFPLSHYLANSLQLSRVFLFLSLSVSDIWMNRDTPGLVKPIIAGQTHKRQYNVLNTDTV